MTAAPLHGVRVVEISSFLSAPFAGLMLADLGAEVIKVEPPTGDPFRHFRRPTTYVGPEWANCNRGKSSVTLDLKESAAARQAAFRLIAERDVFLTNVRPGVTERLGLADDELHKANPQLLRVYITGFGATGPASSKPAFDGVVQAYSGAADAASNGGEPRLTPGFPIDKMTGVFAAQAVLAGILARDRDGSGQRIDVSMLDVASYFGFPELCAQRTMLDHAPPEPWNYQTTTVQPIRCLDGWLVLVAATGRHIAAACAAVGSPEWTDEILAEPDPRKSYELFIERLSSVLPSMSASEWVARFESHGVPAQRCVGIDEHFEDPQVVHNRLYRVDEWPSVGRVRTVRYPALFASCGELRAASPAPELGAQSPVHLRSP